MIAALGESEPWAAVRAGLSALLDACLDRFGADWEGAFAEFERDQIRDRMIAGQRATAERGPWPLLDPDGERTNPLTARYLNRLSDLLFILARLANPAGDVLWKPGG